MGLLLAVDLDASAYADPLRWRPRAREGLVALRDGGYRLIVYSTNLVPHWDSDEVREFLRRERTWDLFDAVWQSIGGPHLVSLHELLGVPLVS